MLLYTEEQLKYAYVEYLRKVEKNNYESRVQVTKPTLEEFRKIFEDTWEMYYADGSNEQ